MDRIDISDITESSSILSRSHLELWKTFTTFLLCQKYSEKSLFFRVQLSYYKPGIFIVNQYRKCTHTPTTACIAATGE